MEHFSVCPKPFSHAINNPQIQQLAKSLPNLADNQTGQQMSIPLQGDSNNQNLQQPIGQNNQNN